MPRSGEPAMLVHRTGCDLARARRYVDVHRWDSCAAPAIAYPVAMQAVAEHAGFRGRFLGTVPAHQQAFGATTYGTVPDAERTIAAVRAIHRRVTGTTPDGRQYRGRPTSFDVGYVAEVDSFLTAYQAFGAEKLTPAEADDYVRQCDQLLPC